jgi:hypothetical protein
MVFLAVLWSVCCALPVSAAGSLDELTPYLSGQYFTWKEFSAGRRLLKESGPLFSQGLLAGFLYPLNTSSSLALRVRGEFFGGIVNYDGETIEQVPVNNGETLEQVPLKTEVNYLGTRQELDLGYRYAALSLHLEPFAGLGYRWWLRGLQNTTLATGEAASGYTESWRTGYLRLGARGVYRPDSGASLFAEAGAKYPFYTANSADPFGTGSNTFRPGGLWSGFAETGVSYRHLRFAFSYEGFRFSQSPAVLVVHKGLRDLLLQPDSSSDIFGLNIGWSF